MPQETHYYWVNSEEVGIHAEQQMKGDDALRIAIEKDFRCLDRSRAGKDERDAYPHPLAKRQSL